MSTFQFSLGVQQGVEPEPLLFCRSPYNSAKWMCSDTGKTFNIQLHVLFHYLDIYCFAISVQKIELSIFKIIIPIMK